MTWFSPKKLAIFDPIQPRLYGSKVQKWSHTIIPYVWEVFWCNRSLKWAELWSQQPWEWPKRLKSEEKWPQNGQFLSIGIFLWHRNYSHINIYWHPWFGPIFSTFGYLEVSFAHNFFILLRMSWKEPAPLCLYGPTVGGIRCRIFVCRNPVMATSWKEGFKPAHKLQVSPQTPPLDYPYSLSHSHTLSHTLSHSLTFSLRFLTST